MMFLALLRVSACAFLLSCFTSPLLASCVDSVWWKVESVQCYGLRNGLLRVDTVFGGERPFYFSLDGQTFSTRPEFDRLWAGTYTVYVRDASGCVTTWVVEVPEPEELVVELATDLSAVEAGQPVHLSATVWPEDAQIVAIGWRPPFLFSDSSSLQQTAFPTVTTTFAIEVVDDRQCVARAQATVEVTRTSVYFPNIIMPTSNSDDYFTVYAGEGVAEVISLQVFARTGEMVFERQHFAPNDPLKGWNGKLKGRRVQAGAYVWVARVAYLDGSVRPFSGAVTVVY
ncbi:MAG TPA: gliding motility-associated C-terminal domain-containing protein [Saprospiraceae bacterium]|nr:gliding motility-associated C-terminal domain-containing protein [Saprospiraceae bacterium]